MLSSQSSRPRELRSRAPLAAPDQVAFCAKITPNVSLSHEGLLRLLLGITAVTLAVDYGALSGGAWPVAAFETFVAMLLAGMLLLNRAQLTRCEIVEVRGGCIEQALFSKGRCIERRMLPAMGARLSEVVDPDYGMLGLTLVSSLGRIELARDLSPAERGSFAEALLDGLKSGGFRVAHEQVRLPALDPDLDASSHQSGTDASPRQSTTRARHSSSH